MDSRQTASLNVHPIQDGTLLPVRVADELRSRIKDGTLPPGTRLSNEMELARALGVSRSTLRAAFDRLMLDGLIVRKRGVGTFVTTQPVVVTHLNINLGVTEFVRSSGAKPGMAELTMRQEPADERVAARLRLEPKAPVIAIERVRTANERRVIFSREFMPAHLLETYRRKFSVQDLEQFLRAEQSLYAFLKQCLGIEVHHGIASLQPVTARRPIAQKLHIPLRSVLMFIDQVDYDADGHPILLSEEWHVAGALTFTVYRTS